MKGRIMKNAIQAVGFVALLFMAPFAAADGPVKEPQDKELTLGVIQRALKAGMSSAEVIEAAGSPNLVTRARNGQESWVYDRFSTESSEQKVRVGGGGLAVGPAVMGGAFSDGSTRKTRTSQRNLLLVVSFGPDGLVESFTYRSSRF